MCWHCPHAMPNLALSPSQFCFEANAQLHGPVKDRASECGLCKMSRLFLDNDDLKDTVFFPIMWLSM